MQLLAWFNFKIVYRPGSRSCKPDVLSRRLEYSPEEEAEHTEQSILKPEHFIISLVQDEPVQEKLKKQMLVQLVAAIQVMKMAARLHYPHGAQDNRQDMTYMLWRRCWSQYRDKSLSGLELS